MALHAKVPKFGDWENKEDVPYTVYFEKAKKNRSAKKTPQIYDPSSNSESSSQALEEAEIKDSGLTKGQDPSKTKQESRFDFRKSTESPAHHKRISRQSVGSDQGFDSSPMHPNHQEKVRKKGSTGSSMWEEVDLRKSTDSPTHPKRTSMRSVGSDQSFDSSPMHPYQQGRVRNKASTDSSTSERKVSSGSHGAPPSTPGRSRFGQVPLDENPDESPAIPKFGGWDDNDPTSGERYTEVFNKVREDRQAGGRSPMVTTENTNFYGQRNENLKGCGCFPWGRK